MADNFQLYAKYYNLLNGDKNYSAEVDYVNRLLKTYLPSSNTILEFGSGTGLHGLLLQKRGYEVYGLERSEGMVALAKQNGLPCEVADISNFALNIKFDAVVSLFHVVSYLTSNEILISTFINANNHLNDEGVFLFDVWYSPAVYAQRAKPRIKKMKNSELEVTRIAEPKIICNSNVIDVQFTVIAKDLHSNETSELIESHPMRHFSIPEMELLAALTGFKIIKVEEFLSGNSPSENSWGVCFIFKKV